MTNGDTKCPISLEDNVDDDEDTDGSLCVPKADIGDDSGISNRKTDVHHGERNRSNRINSSNSSRTRKSEVGNVSGTRWCASQRKTILNPYTKSTKSHQGPVSNGELTSSVTGISSKNDGKHPLATEKSKHKKRSIRSISNRTQSSKPSNPQPKQRPRLLSGLVIDHDETTQPLLNSVGDSNFFASYIRLQQARQQNTNSAHLELYHDPDFQTLPESIEGVHTTYQTVVKCRCSPPQPAVLAYSKGSYEKNKTNNNNHKSSDASPSNNHKSALINVGRPYYQCRNKSTTASPKKCNYFKWAYGPHLVHWYRFGAHNHHRLVDPLNGYSADDLVQGTVGDCWFLSALAVVAERPDLIQRLFPSYNDGDVGVGASAGTTVEELDRYGMVEVKLFVDGWWKTVVMDTFLPCSIEYRSSRRRQRLVMASMNRTEMKNTSDSSSSLLDPHALADASRDMIRETKRFLLQDRGKKMPFRSDVNESEDPIRLPREIHSIDLAYSKAKGNQLWVPFLEKAYAKIHGSYQAISGGYVAEAFLDLTGAPTLTYSFDSPSFSPKTFWSLLLSYRQKRLPMGCGTSTSQVGIIGGHAYSILDVREVRNVGVDFFTERLVQGTLGGVSGFTEYDGVVRLLRVRNPHGEGEWKGRFSDGSAEWERLLRESNGGGMPYDFERTMEDDGTFWIDYDSFLMGFTNVDVVLAFCGNHAKSFCSNFPPKKSVHRCSRAFELTMLDDQPGMSPVDSVEVYAMLIQKTKRGASRGRVDRKKSYKICDMGLFVAAVADDGMVDYGRPIEGRFLGMTRVGHHRIILRRGNGTTSKVILPVSFGHPAATDKDMEFTVRFVSDAPLMIRELKEVPRMDRVLHQFCMNCMTRRILWNCVPGYRVFLVDCSKRGGGGTVFFYLHVTDDDVRRDVHGKRVGVPFSIQANCRGMVCRTEEGLVDHEKNTEPVAPRRKFTAAWRRFKREFVNETKSRLLMVLVQSGQDWEFNGDGVFCSKFDEGYVLGSGNDGDTDDGGCFRKKEWGDLKEYRQTTLSSTESNEEYTKRGIFGHVLNDLKKHNLYLDENVAMDVAKTAGMPFLQDSEFEKALAVSKNEEELRRVLEISKESNGSPSVIMEGEDLDLQYAIAMSKTDSIATNHQNGTHNKEDDVDLAKVIQLSLGDHRKKESDQVSTEGSLIDVNHSSHSAQQSRDNKSREIIEILDDDDDVCGTEIEVKDVKEVPPLKCNKPSEDLLIEEKRKLALTAALKRFKK